MPSELSFPTSLLLPQQVSSTRALLTTLANAAFTVLVLVDGWVVNFDSIPIVFRWVKWISPLAYGYEALVINEFKGEDFYCTEEQAAQSGGYCPVENGDDVITILSMESASISRSIGVIIAASVFFRLLYFFAIKYKKQA